MPPERKGSVRRETKETQVTVEMNLDGSGRADITTGIGMLDHLLEQLPRHSLFDITIEASGDIERSAAGEQRCSRSSCRRWQRAG